MNIDRSVTQRAVLFAALGEPVRLAVAESLVCDDRSPASLAREFDLASNLIAHHVNVLVDAGVVTRKPSQADRRRVYLTLTDRGRAAVTGPPLASAHKIVFVCTHNSARSQFAEVLWRSHSSLPVQSMGTHPAQRVHPKAVDVAGRRGLDLRRAQPHVLAGDDLDDALVVTVCDNADEELAPLGVAHLHWSVPDPARDGRTAAFDRAFTTIAARVDQLAERLVS